MEIRKSGQQCKKVLIIGAGLAGCEAATYLADRGISVVLAESKRLVKNPAQKSDGLAELVCTNSLKSIRPATAHGLLKYEMDGLGSLILKTARKCAVPAGDALAVDREKFSDAITAHLEDHPLIELVDVDVKDPRATAQTYGCELIVIASGPLTNPSLEKWIGENISNNDLYFYDAIAPVVDADSLDYGKLYFKDRYCDESEETPSYLNAPMNREEYQLFIRELRAAEKVPAKDFEEFQFFEGCLPIDLMAERGEDTPRFSCMKPVGLEWQGERPYAVVQLRKENLRGEAYNLVGFQTRLTYGEQQRVFRLIPGLEQAKFIHLGSVHRNTYLHAKKLLDWDMRCRTDEKIYFAGQITGVEGYTESAASGLYVAFQLARRLKGEESLTFPVETAMGALINYIMTVERPSPSNINFGLLPSISLSKVQRKRKDRKRYKKELVANRARETYDRFMGEMK